MGKSRLIDVAVGSLVPSLERSLSSRSSHAQRQWKTRFARSVQAFAQSQLQLASSLGSETVPTLSEYILLRRESYGSSMYLDLLDLLEIASPPTGASSKD